MSPLKTFEEWHECPCPPMALVDRVLVSTIPWRCRVDFSHYSQKDEKRHASFLFICWCLVSTRPPHAFRNYIFTRSWKGAFWSIQKGKRTNHNSKPFVFITEHLNTYTYVYMNMCVCTYISIHTPYYPPSYILLLRYMWHSTTFSNFYAFFFTQGGGTLFAFNCQRLVFKSGKCLMLSRGV